MTARSAQFCIGEFYFDCMVEIADAKKRLSDYPSSFEWHETEMKDGVLIIAGGKNVRIIPDSLKAPGKIKRIFKKYLSTNRVVNLDGTNDDDASLKWRIFVREPDVAKAAEESTMEWPDSDQKDEKSTTGSKLFDHCSLLYAVDLNSMPIDLPKEYMLRQKPKKSKA